jgi:hypothetical protein
VVAEPLGEIQARDCHEYVPLYERGLAWVISGQEVQKALSQLTQTPHWHSTAIYQDLVAAWHILSELQHQDGTPFIKRSKASG